MSDEPDSPTLRMLRRMDEKLNRVTADLLEIKERIGFLEAGYVSLSRRVDLLRGHIDQIETRLGRIERRLDLTEAAP